MSKLLWLGGLTAEIVGLVRQLVDAIRHGRSDEAQQLAERAAKRALFIKMQREKRR